MHTRLAILLLLIWSTAVLAAESSKDGPATIEATKIDWKTCQDSAAIDAFLREVSPFYTAMARFVEFEGGYKFEDRVDLAAGKWNAASRTIELHKDLRGAHRASIIAFEMTNAYQQKLHTEVDSKAAGGAIATETEFALLHELIEYDGLRLHRTVLEEIEKHLGRLPGDFFFTCNPKPKAVKEYQLPLVTDYLKHMKASGHTAHYYPWFRHQQKQGGK